MPMNKPQKVFLCLGTNLGDRKKNINKAIFLLNLQFARKYCEISDIINTEAVGFEGPDFLNCVVVYKTRRSPQSLLRLCKKVERIMGRDDKPEYDTNGNRVYHDRIIDIDILLYGNIEIDTPELTIPHPQVRTRAHVRELLESLPCKEDLHLM